MEAPEVVVGDDVIRPGPVARRAEEGAEGPHVEEVGLEDGVPGGRVLPVADVVHEASDHAELVADVHCHPFEHLLGVPRTRRHGSILTCAATLPR